MDPDEVSSPSYEELGRYLAEEIAYIYLPSEESHHALIPQDPDNRIGGEEAPFDPLAAITASGEADFLSGAIDLLRREGWDSIHLAYFLAAFSYYKRSRLISRGEELRQKYSTEQISEFEKLSRELYWRWKKLEKQYGYTESTVSEESPMSEIKQSISENVEQMRRVNEDNPEVKAAGSEYIQYTNINHELQIASLHPFHLRQYESAKYHMMRLEDFIADETRAGLEKAAKQLVCAMRTIGKLGWPLAERLRAESGL